MRIYQRTNLANLLTCLQTACTLDKAVQEAATIFAHQEKYACSHTALSS